MKELDEVTDHSVFPRPDEIIVELRGRTIEDEYMAITYQFEPTKSGSGTVEPRDSIDDAHEETVCEILVDAGYQLTTS